jgi:tripartite ATP-independent transporter DctP family solute receptor
MLRFAQLVEERTAGAIKIRVFSGAQLGSTVNVISGVQTGIVDFVQTTTGSYTSFFPRMQVFDLPFLFKDAPSAERLLDGPIGQELLTDMIPKGLYGLTWGTLGWRDFETRRQPVKEPADLNGLKIRIQPSPVFAAMIKAVGAIPITLDTSELYMGLSQNTVDGCEMPLVAVVGYKLYEVSRYIALSNHVYNPAVLAASKTMLDSLEPKEQEAIREAAKELQPIWRKLIAEGTEVSRKFCEQNGMTVTATDFAAFQRAVRPVYAEFREKIGADLVDRVMKATNA